MAGMKPRGAEEVSVLCCLSPGSKCTLQIYCNSGHSCIWKCILAPAKNIESPRPSCFPSNSAVYLLAQLPVLRGRPSLNWLAKAEVMVQMSQKLRPRGDVHAGTHIHEHFCLLWCPVLLQSPQVLGFLPLVAFACYTLNTSWAVVFPVVPGEAPGKGLHTQGPPRLTALSLSPDPGQYSPCWWVS